MLSFASYVMGALDVVIVRWTASRNYTIAVPEADRDLGAEKL